MAYISILIPAYNSVEYILRALDSIPIRDDIEIIVANDASTDQTLDKLLSYNKQPIKVLNYKTNHGVGYIRNELIQKASGKWICWLDSDDYFYTNELNKVFSELKNLDNNDRVFIKAKTNNNSIKTSSCEPWLHISKRTLYINHPFKNIRRAEDWYWGLEVKKLKLKIVKLPFIAYHYNYPREGSLSYNYKLNKAR